MDFGGRGLSLDSKHKVFLKAAVVGALCFAPRYLEERLSTGSCEMFRFIYCSAEYNFAKCGSIFGHYENVVKIIRE